MAFAPFVSRSEAGRVGSTNSDFGLIHAGPARTPKPCSCNIAQTRYSLANRTAIIPLLATEPISEDRQITLTQLIALPV
jgi:hypothetical protein